MSDVDGLPRATWDEQVRLALKAEAVGFDAIIPLARWRGHGGTTDPHHRSFEAFTWAAGIAAVTERINVFATCHVPTIHPLMAAKMSATIDHISNGRFGLNVVAGWQPDELRMFGADQNDHDERYAIADEWLHAVRQLWEVEGSHDFTGQHISIPAGFSEPKPLQKPYPPLMSAGASPAGQDFAARNCDLIFVAVEDPARLADKVAAIKKVARDRYGRELKVFGVGHITCADTDETAAEEYQRVIVRHGDWKAAKLTVAKLMAHSKTIDYESVQTRQLMEGVIRAFFAYPLTGSPATVVNHIAELARAGLDGMAITWNDYDLGLQQYQDQLLPRLMRAGLRDAPTPSPERMPSHTEARKYNYASVDHTVSEKERGV